jgi:hypothetical protein
MIPWWFAPLYMALGMGIGFLIHARFDKTLRSMDWVEGYEAGLDGDVKEGDQYE